MNNLPNEILPIVAGYLPSSDAIKLNNTCKKFHSRLSLTATAPHSIITEFSRRNPDGDAHYGFLIPVPNQVSCHSMRVSMIWQDQGWGDRKGQVFVVAEEENQLYHRSSQNFGGGRLVYTSAIASHEKQSLAIEFQPKENETYHVWYKVGSGGGHSLSLSSVNVQALLFDDTSRCFVNAYNFLAKTEALPAWDMKSWGIIIHLDVEEFVITHEHHLLPALMSFPNRRILSDIELQRKLKRFMQSIWELWMEDYHASAKSIAESSVAQQQQRFCQPFFRRDAMQVHDLSEDMMDFEEGTV